MGGTIIITGANGSLALGFVESLLSSYPSYTLIAAVRNVSRESDQNTAKLMEVISAHKDAQVSVEQIDLSSLSSVRLFADRISERVAQGKLPPISAVVCNAFTWSLDRQKFTSDGYESCFQVSHLSHYLLVLKLLGSMAPTGRIVMLGSDSHYPERKNPLSSLVAEFPQNLEVLVKPEPDNPGDEHDRGFQRYGTAKLANVMFMHDLNSRLQNNPKLAGITVVAMDPGALAESRAHAAQRLSVRLMLSAVSIVLPVLKHVVTGVRSTADAGRDLVDLSVGDDFSSVRGYFEGRTAVESALVSRDREKQRALWEKCWKWTVLDIQETALKDI